ncbi:DNA gyrase subunit A [Mucisphaera calidilacus]|uniref:DNA topoisomerase (ATP-hydrolyzing) n=1 Tax=Mucisphaera calidilacus TaxID=2527982 RepID=A0A518BXC0_9BACT|nr:DNA gyrase subunit A [Mucisphaera calidilacus]QDU71623.1 DNA gyrase subunit A [Mucisphaera calidilacus]
MTDTPQDPHSESESQVPDGGRTVDLAIEQELAESYLTYAMSTIVDRALPDVRDGLKPSQRRILVAMNDLNLSPGRKHSKCAGIVGETMKKYHPHGDQAIYPTLVNMAQEWKTRYLLIDKQGNFGSIDPDPPAAMRYTEARMHRHTTELLDDLKLDTVEWQANFDETVDEPRYLPARFPNLLVNGSVGIAVGMACSIPPHNLGEICDAITRMVDEPDLELRELMEMVPGPDFPTGGIICGRRGIVDAYSTGRGRVTVRAKIQQETTPRGRELLIVSEMPYQVSKNEGVIEKIKQQIRNDKLTDIANVVDESSNRAGMRLVIELKRGADPTAVENQLYRLTPLQSTFSIISIALVKGQPRTLSLSELIKHYIAHRRDVIRRRTAYRLMQAQQEAHRIEGLIYAVCDIDEVIRLIRESQTREEAIDKLMARGFRIPPDHQHAPKIPARLLAQSADSPIALTRVQAESIGRLQLIQLVGLEIEHLVANYAKLVEQIEEYESILASPARVDQIVKDETADLKSKYADERRTVIQEGEVGELNLAELTPVERVAVTITHTGYAKRLPVEEYRVQNRGGKGVIGSKSREGDFTEHVFVSSTHDDLLCFTDRGRVFRIKVFEIPEASRTSRGTAIINMLNLQQDERVRAFMPISDFEKGEYFLLFATKKGLVKRTALKDYRNVNSAGIIAVNLKDDDELMGVIWTAGNDHVLLGTRRGMAIRFNESDARVMGRAAAGVKGIDLAGGDSVVGLIKIPEGEEADLLTITVNGYGKRTPTSEYLVQAEDGARPQSRGGKGRRDIVTAGRNGQVAAVRRVTDADSLMLITQHGMVVRVQADTIRQTGRATQGVRVISIRDDDQVTSVAAIREDEDAEDITDQPQADAPPESSEDN